MAHIEWSDDLNTGIQVIDNQHKRIADYINRLDDNRATHDQEQIDYVLNELVDYCQSHFTFEESLMEEAEYPFLNAHKRVHQTFVLRVDDFKHRFKLGEDISDELLHTLRAWLLNHIRNDDNDYVKLVSSNLNRIHDEQKDD